MSSLSKINIPMIKKVYPRLIASQLVGVQPLSQPASLIYHLRYRYARSVSFDNVYYAIVAIKRGELILSKNIETPNVECVLTKRLSDKVFAIVFENGTVRRFSKYTVDENGLIVIKIKFIRKEKTQEANEQEVIIN